MKKVSVTIAIPAYNEEKNIVQLLTKLCLQSYKGLSLQEIIVVSDGSSDKTNSLVKSIRNKKINLVLNKTRKGQSAIQNKLFSCVNSEILVILEADTIPLSNDFILRLTDPLIKEHEIKYSQGNIMCVKPISFVGRILYAHFNIIHSLYLSRMDTKEKICTGLGGRAYVKSFYKELHIPRDVPEDVYTLLWSKERGHKVSFAESAVSQFQVPQTLSDFIKKEKKLNGGKNSLNKYFKEKVLNEHYSKGQNMIRSYILSFIFKNFLFFVSFFVLKVISFIKTSNYIFQDIWQVSNSTKKLQANNI